MPTRVKTQSEIRAFPWDFDELIATGAIISTVEAFITESLPDCPAAGDAIG